MGQTLDKVQLLEQRIIKACYTDKKTLEKKKMMS